jgi:glutamine synthetase
VECQHHEVATAGQAEIDMRFKPLLLMGDQLMWFKYVLKNVANRRLHRNLHAQTLFEDNGTGMHTHQHRKQDRSGRAAR